MIRRRPVIAAGRAAGWTLVELAVVLVVLGAIGVALWRLLPLAPEVAAGDAARRDLVQAEQALLGYAIANARLPAPVIENGRAMLPVEALGLPTSMKLRYQVQPALTVSPGDLFGPLLPPLVGVNPPDRVVTAEINGLDFCIALHEARGLSLPGMDGVPAAFALLHPGGRGHDRTINASFVLPGSAAQRDLVVSAVGPGEFASRLACADRVSRANGAARAAYVAYDLAGIAAEHERFRSFAVDVARLNKASADTAVVFAGFDVAFGVFIEAVAILQEAAGWPPDAVGIAVGIASHATAIVQLGLAIDALVQAVADQQDAEDALAVAQQQETAAITTATRLQGLAITTLEDAQAIDRKGLEP